jgi:ABC-type iron transport system FetAB permease component
METLAITIGGLLLKYGPDVVDKFVDIIHKQDPTVEDYAALTATARQSADDYINAEISRRSTPAIGAA